MNLGVANQFGSLLMETLEPSRAIQRALLGIRADEISSLIAPSLPSLEISSVLAASVARSISIRPSLGAELLKDYEMLKPMAFQTAGIQAVLGQLDFPGLKSLETVCSLNDSLTVLSTLSATAWNDFDRSSALTRGVPKWIWEAPIVQTHFAALNVAQIAAAEETEHVDYDAAVEPDKDFRGALPDRLRALGPEYAEPFLGAREVLRARKWDYCRHAAISLRELLDKLLDRFAPMTSVKAAKNTADLLKKGQTNRARLLYLFRNVASGPYAEFIEKDIEHILQTFYALNKATHSLEKPYDDRVLRVLLARVEGHLLVLLEAGDDRQS